MTEITLEAPDISCDHCIASIEKAMTKLPGVRFVGGDPTANAKQNDDYKAKNSTR